MQHINIVEIILYKRFLETWRKLNFSGWPLNCFAKYHKLSIGKPQKKSSNFWNKLNWYKLDINFILEILNLKFIV